MNQSYPKVCIIGGGSSGMITCKRLQDRGVPFDCFEASDRVGGNWIFKNKNGMSAAYRSLHINTSKRKMEFKCFPMPDTYPDYPHHSLIAEYFENFIDHFKLRDKITFNTKVEEAVRLDDGSWRITLDNGDIRRYDALVVANGHHWDPQWPEPKIPGKFSGTEMHSHSYLDPQDPYDFRDKVVVIVGMGNSAMDIACELGNPCNAKKVYLSARRGTYILPKYFDGKTTDHMIRHPGDKPEFFEKLLPHSLIFHLGNKYLNWKVRRTVGLPQNYGLPEPEHDFGETHPTISDEIHIRLGSGDVIPTAEIKEFRGRQVVFADGRQVEADFVIYATGYKVSFPFFKQTNLQPKNNEMVLFKRMFSADYNNLFFIGLVQPLCSIMPIAEVQAGMLAEYLTGEYALPSKEYMLQNMKDVHETMKKMYVSSKRHTLQIECMEYTYDLNRELTQGYKRAKANRMKLPIPARNLDWKPIHSVGKKREVHAQ
ncbi:MAG: flavin-containing monooxygenase [Oligoflexus sp.]